MQRMLLLSEGKGHTFESCRVRHEINNLETLSFRHGWRGYHMATSTYLDWRSATFVLQTAAVIRGLAGPHLVVRGRC